MNAWTERREGQGVVMDRKIPEEIASIRTIQEDIDEITPFVVGGLIVVVVEICLLNCLFQNAKRARARICFFLKKTIRVKERDIERQTQAFAPFFLFSLCIGEKRESSVQMLVRETEFRKQREYAQESAPVKTGIAQYRG